MNGIRITDLDERRVLAFDVKHILRLAGPAVLDAQWPAGLAPVVRFVISASTPDSCRFEQSFSEDGGKTWEVNWIAIDSRMKGES